MPEWTGRPVVMNIKAGETIAYCMCGLSKDGPVCDGTFISACKTLQRFYFDNAPGRNYHGFQI